MRWTDEKIFAFFQGCHFDLSAEIFSKIFYSRIDNMFLNSKLDTPGTVENCKIFRRS